MKNHSTPFCEISYRQAERTLRILPYMDRNALNNFSLWAEGAGSVGYEEGLEHVLFTWEDGIKRGIVYRI